MNASLLVLVLQHFREPQPAVLDQERGFGIGAQQSGELVSQVLLFAFAKS